MKRLFATAVVAMMVTAGLAQNITKHVEPVETFIGQTQMVGTLSAGLLEDFKAAYGITINAFDDKPKIFKTEIVIQTIASKDYAGINAGSKLILKSGGTTVFLITPDGSQWDGGMVTVVETDEKGEEHVEYISEAHYPITAPDLELLMKNGFTKYRLQTATEVFEHELDESKAQKCSEKLSEAYQKIREEQLKMAKMVNDLSDF
ncbi:MAG: hypothetical protein PUJ24_00110 [Bacteroidales bacterium]|nr:hypothetical protein [Bacteroidales bacterium]